MTDMRISRYSPDRCPRQGARRSDLRGRRCAAQLCFMPPWRSRPSQGPRSPSLDTQLRSRVPGVRLVLTHQTIGDVKSAGFIMGGGYGFQSFQPMLSPAIAYRGPADRAGCRRHARSGDRGGALVEATYATEPFSVTLDAAGTEIVNQADTPLQPLHSRDRSPATPTRPSLQAPVKIEAVFNCPPQHQNPIELIATVAEWTRRQAHHSRRHAERRSHPSWPCHGARARPPSRSR